MPSTEPERIKVAVGLVFDSESRILIGQRTTPDRHRGKWEFPGGKVEPHESVDEALSRELWEEVGISVNRTDHFMTFAYDYPDRKVLLNFRLVRDYEGTPLPRESQSLKWVSLARLEEFDMLAPNVSVIDELIRKYG